MSLHTSCPSGQACEWNRWKHGDGSSPGRGQFHKAAPTVAEPAQLLLCADMVGNVQGFENELKDEHGESKDDEEEEEACESETDN
eukprot:1305816-Prymnesium_polylepis.2